MLLQTAAQRLSEVAKVDMRDVRRTLQLQRGGSEALCALALLTGGDYDMAGLDQVGKTGAIRIICHLLQGREVSTAATKHGMLAWCAWYLWVHGVLLDVRSRLPLVIAPLQKHRSVVEDHSKRQTLQDVKANDTSSMPGILNGLGPDLFAGQVGRAACIQHADCASDGACRTMRE